MLCAVRRARLSAESTSVKLKSKQEEIFEVEKEVACRSITVKNMVDDTGLDAPVPLPATGLFAPALPDFKFRLKIYAGSCAIPAGVYIRRQYIGSIYNDLRILQSLHAQ